MVWFALVPVPLWSLVTICFSLSECVFSSFGMGCFRVCSGCSVFLFGFIVVKLLGALCLVSGFAWASIWGSACFVWMLVPCVLGL